MFAITCYIFAPMFSFMHEKNTSGVPEVPPSKDAKPVLQQSTEAPKQEQIQQQHGGPKSVERNHVLPPCGSIMCSQPPIDPERPSPNKFQWFWGYGDVRTSIPNIPG